MATSPIASDLPTASTAELPGANKPAQLIIDILIVAAVSGAAFLFEMLAFAQGWLPFETEIRGAISVVVGAITAARLVIVRGGTLADLGFRQPERWSIVPLQVAAILIAFIVANAALPLLISLFITLPEADFSRYDSIAGNLPAALGMILILPLTASVPEEVIYRGFLMGRLTQLLGEDRRGSLLTILIQALIFACIHFQWGIGGMLMTFGMGLVWGSAYLLCGRNLWVVILAHSGGHILFVVQLYYASRAIV